MKRIRKFERATQPTLTMRRIEPLEPLPKFDFASAQRVILATKRVKEALDSVEGLKPAERSQALMSLTLFGIVDGMLREQR